MIRLLTNMALCLGAALLWWAGNIRYGNLEALAFLGWLAAYPWWVGWVAAILPSISQLYITEQWGEEELDPLSMMFAAFVAIIVDLGGPVIGFYMTTGWSFNMGTLAAAIIFAAFTSILCQHVAWTRAKKVASLLGSWGSGSKPAPPKPRPTPTRLMEKLGPRTQQPNGKKEPHDPKKVGRRD